MNEDVQKIFGSWWLRYSVYIHNIMGIQTQYDEGDVSYWRELSFVKIIVYLLPVSFLAMAARISLGLLEGHSLIAGFDLGFYLVLITIIFQRKIPLGFKRVFVMVMFYLFALVTLFVQGAEGPGLLYFTCTCTFTVFLFKGNKIYYFLLANFIIFITVDLIIYYQAIPTPLLQDFTPISWLNHTSTLLFINLVTLILIQRIIRRLEKIIIRESELLGQLEDEALEIAELNNKLAESEDYYRYLFANNPSPMWVYDTATLHFLQVNDAALQLYGYSREEFLQLTLEDLRPASEMKQTLKMFSNYRKNQRSFKGNMVHLKKNKRTFHVEVRSNPIEVNGRTGLLVMATDITDRVRYINSIEAQNNRLKHIAWIQSHKVRAPLARVMSLSNLMAVMDNEQEKEEILNYLIVSADELNDIIVGIIKQAEQE
jgi:PAS domain S-box-containing protein